MRKILSIVLFLGLLAAGSTAIADDDPCSFISTEDGHQVNPRHISIVQSLSHQKTETGSNLNRHLVILITSDGTRVKYQAYNWESSRDSAIMQIRNKVERCLNKLESIKEDS